MSGTRWDTMAARHARERRALMRKALMACDWNVSRAAKWLGAPLPTVRSAIATFPDLALELDGKKLPQGRPVGS